MDVTARWREAGRWWAGESPVEVVEYRDKNGVKREKVTELPKLSSTEPSKEYQENSKEDYDLRPRKLRDEKVAIACGYEESKFVSQRRKASCTYVPLCVMSGYSFGRSVLFARELPRRAADLGIPAIALTDWFSLAGAMEFSKEAIACGVKPLVGVTVEMEEGGTVRFIARSPRGYRSLSRFVTRCHLSNPRLFPLATRDMVLELEECIALVGGEGSVTNLAILRGDLAAARGWIKFAIECLGRENVFCLIERAFLPWERKVNPILEECAQTLGILCVAGGTAVHAGRDSFPAQDIVVCAETLCTVEELIGRKPQRHPDQPTVPQTPSRRLNAEGHLKSPHAMALLFTDRPDLLNNTMRIADAVAPYVMPPRSELPCLNANPDHDFVKRVMSGANDRHGQIGHRLKLRLGHEIDRILKLGFADHFLVASELCDWARSRGYLFSGRGSVVDSAVAYCLGISRIDAYEHKLHFDRFLPADGSKRPDIDIDFEAKHRDDVRNHLVETYGKDHVATVGAFGAFCSRGIIREVGKALELSPAAIDFIAKRTHRGVSPEQIESAMEKRPELRDSAISKERLHWLFKLAADLTDVPRNLRAHSSGVVVTKQPVTDYVPLTWSASMQDDGEEQSHLRIMQWDKRSAKHCFDKFDLLCLRGQDVLSGAMERIRLQNAGFEVEQVPLNDPETYRAMRSGELVGIPQSASPAMRQAHMRIRTDNLHDASLVQAGIRPGVGGAVKLNELIARRNGTKTYVYEHPDIEPILGNTYGIVVFQEQIDQLLQLFAGYSGGEAEDIRDAIHKNRRNDYGDQIKDTVVKRILSRGYTAPIAEHVYTLIAGFKGYGFAQGHALAFAEISIRSIYCQQNFPAEYFASMLEAQPSGYYSSCTLVNEARYRGVTILPPCVLKSEIGFTVEDVQTESPIHLTVPNAGIRIGLKQVGGLSRQTQQRIVEARQGQSMSLTDFVKTARPDRDELEALVLCGALDCFCTNRRALLWSVPDLITHAEQNESPLGIQLPAPHIDLSIADFSDAEKNVRERQVLDLDVSQHLMAYERERVSARGVITTKQAQNLKNRAKAFVVGNPIRLRFPPTPSGKRVVFFDLEDETGLLNVTCFDRVYQLDGVSIVTCPYVTVLGEAQWREGHMAFLAKRVFAYDPVISKLANRPVSELPVTCSDFLVG